MANRFLSFLGFGGNLIGNNSGAKQDNKNIGNSSMRIPLQRLTQSIKNWRKGTEEAEYTIPHRVIMQQLYNDLIDEPHTAACIERRMDLTLLRDFTIDCGNDSDTAKWTEWLKESPWFIDFQRYVLTAKIRGYSLISMGNIVSNEAMVNGLPEMKMLEHSLISPDRRNFASVVYAVNGVSWDEPQYSPWHIYIDTPTEIGNGCCGYGILHKVAMAIILIRANFSDNANYNEKFGQPIAWGKTSKQDDDTSSDRTDFFNDLKSMGAAGTFVTDLTDEIQFLMASGSGQGFKSFADLEMRAQKLISKNLLGHADVLDSIPKRSGGSSGESNPSTPSTPVQDALSDITSKDGKFITPFVQELLRKMQAQGVNLPNGFKFKYKNDDEEELAKQKKYNAIQSFADIAVAMKQGGLQMAPEVFTKETEVECKIAEVTPPKLPLANEKPNALPVDIKNKLKAIYS